jgi:hypothetical protein
MKSKMLNAYLVGPFVGELIWEFFRFAPYIIHLKKNRPKTKIIVFTRDSRFDLYGQYADILVPLNIPNDLPEKHSYFTIQGLDSDKYNKLAEQLLNKYKKRFKIIKHIYPDISYFYYKLKWQFPRDSMDYNFKPRKENMRAVNEYINNDKIVLVNFNFSEGMPLVGQLESSGYFTTFINMFSEHILLANQPGTSLLGCIIELLKRCDFVITKFNSYIANLALLVGTPIIAVGETPSYDSLLLMNPLNTPVIKCDNITDGIDIWKDMKHANNI